MRNLFLLSVIVFLFSQILLAEDPDITLNRPEVYFRFVVQSRDEITLLTRIVSIDNVIGDTVYAYANDAEFERFKALNREYELLTPPSLKYKPRMADSIESIQEWDDYPTYEAYRDMMIQFASDYPEICRIDSIGESVQGRGLFFAIISDNVHLEEQEPEFMYTATIHGDETVGYYLMLRLIDYLLINYQVDEKVTNLIDNLEIWINPLANPDGTYYAGNSSVYGARRYNAINIDLNRNFPNPVYGDHPDYNSWQPETMAMMELALRKNFVLSANFHGGAEVLNYPWDCWQRRHTDDNWLIWLCRQYADTVHANCPSGYLTDLNDGITNGWDWYDVYGSRQDYMTYYRHCREVTIEISNEKLPAATALADYWEYNKNALLNYMSAALTGIRGEIQTDRQLSNFQVSIVGLENINDNSFSVPDDLIGDYYRVVLPGIYDIEFSDGFELKTIENVIVNPGLSARVNFISGTNLPGDVNGDSEINVADILMIQSFISNRSIPDETQFEAADWNNDGILDQHDLARILDFVANLYP